MKALMKSVVACATLFLAIAVSQPAVGLDFTGLTGSGAPVTNMQPSLAMTYVIRTAPSSYYFWGEIGLFAGNVAPSGWTVADGRMLDVNSNSTLWNVIGTKF